MQIEGKLEKATINIASDIEQITKFVLQIFWNEEEIETLKKPQVIWKDIKIYIQFKKICICG